MSLLEICASIIKHEEGFSSKAYYCTEGYPTIGFGKVIGSKGDTLSDEVTTVEAETIWLNSMLQDIICLVSNRHIIEWQNCNDARRAILVSMCYQLGLVGLSNFKMMLLSISHSDFNSAALHMLDSKWNRQTPNRAARHAEQMQTGELLRQYE